MSSFHPGTNGTGSDERCGERRQSSTPAMMNAAPAPKKSGKLSSSKHRRRKRRESRDQRPEDGMRQSKDKERATRVSRSPLLKPVAVVGSQKRPRIDEHEQIIMHVAAEKNSPVRMGDESKNDAHDLNEVTISSSAGKKEVSATPKQQIDRKKRVMAVSSPKKNHIKPIHPKLSAKAKAGGGSSKSKLSSTSYRKMKRRRSTGSNNKENNGLLNRSCKLKEETKAKTHDIMVAETSLECRFDACMGNFTGESDVCSSSAASSGNENHELKRSDGDNVQDKKMIPDPKIPNQEVERVLAQTSSRSADSSTINSGVQCQLSNASYSLDIKVAKRIEQDHVRVSSEGNILDTSLNGKLPAKPACVGKNDVSSNINTVKNCDGDKQKQADEVLQKENLCNCKVAVKVEPDTEKTPQAAELSAANAEGLFDPKIKSDPSNEDMGKFINSANEDIDSLIKKLSVKPEPKKKQVTLTQGEFLEAVGEKVASKTERGNGEKDNMKSVKIRKCGSLKDEEYSEGHVWQSADTKYHGLAFTLGRISVVNMEHVAEVSQMWMKLENTYIGPEQAANVKKSCIDCEWVMVEEHGLMPKDRRVQLKTLCNKLGAGEIPKSTLYYKEEPPFFAYMYKDEGQFAPPSKQDRPIVLDLFAGGGGMSIGLKRAGWNVKYKVDKDMACCQTLRKNFSKKKVYNKDMTGFLRELKSGRLKIDTTKITLVHGSPPCQGFSGANTSGGNNDWQNKQATIDFLEVVEYIQPPFVSMENVPGMAQKRKINDAKDTNRSYLEKVMGTLISLGYHVSATMTWASHFGDPQNRKRLVLLAAKRGYKLPSVPKKTHGENDELKPIVNVKDVLHDLENIEPNCSGRVELKNGKVVQGHFIDGTAKTSANDDDERLYAKHPLAPAKTVRKKNNICHYKLDRYLTILEYKRLMSFPDSHKLEGIRREMRDQIGNAVPCHFAEAIGKAIMESYHLGSHTIPLPD